MKRNTIQRIIIFAVIAFVGVISTQLYLINTARDLQQKEQVRQIKQDSLNQLEFDDRVITALSNIAQQILKANNDPADTYKAVEQLRPNYFVVRINDTLNPEWLERLLKWEFDRNNITENYRYGIYDCFTDSIVYQNLVTPNGQAVLEENIDEPQIKWNTDNHYFSVTFPDKASLTPDPPTEDMNPWIIMAIGAIAIMLGLITYTLWIILRQKRLSEVKTDFINNMTHELKTPISTISLSSEVLLKPEVQNDKDRINRYAQIIHEENNRLQNQVERVLQLAKLDRGEVQLKKSTLDAHDLIEQAVKHQSVRIEDLEGKIECSLDASNSTIEGDPVHINNIINNLLDNAIKYSDKAPEIQIKTSNKGSTIEIKIIDNGIGIKKEHLKQIFDKFYRVPTGDLHDVKGFGLGLYYVQELVKQHGGKLEVKSEFGKGSEFTICLLQ